MLTSQTFLASTTAGLTTFEASSLGQSLSEGNFTNWPATCFFGMWMRNGTDEVIYSGEGDFFVQLSTASSGGATVSVPMTTTWHSSEQPGFANANNDYNLHSNKCKSD